MATSKTLYTGKRELTMAEYEELETIDINKDYNITDYPNVGITNEQMTFALTCARLFPENSTFTCIDDGTYGLGKTYKIKVIDGVKSWEEVPTGSGGEKKYLHHINVEGFNAAKVFVDIITNDNTPILTRVSLATWLYNNGYRTADTAYQATGGWYTGTNTSLYDRIFAPNTTTIKTGAISLNTQQISIDGVIAYTLAKPTFLYEDYSGGGFDSSGWTDNVQEL